jgi:hypothetical protein
MIHAPGGYPKKAVRPVYRQKFIDFLTGCFQVSVRRASGVNFWTPLPTPFVPFSF